MESSDDSTTISINSMTKVAHLRKMPDYDIFKLIESVKAFPCIWNVRAKSYSNETDKQNAWKMIGRQLKGVYTEIDLRMSWSTLRMNYIIQYRQPYASELRKFFLEMDFLTNDGTLKRKKGANERASESSDSSSPESKRYRMARESTVSSMSGENVDDLTRLVLGETPYNEESDSESNKSLCQLLYTELTSRSGIAARNLRTRINNILIKTENA